MVELRILGATELRRDDRDVHSFLAGPKRLGLLVYLVLARPRGFQRRDAILPLFWPQRGQKAARNALSNMLYHIRRELGDDVITNRGAEEISVQMDGFWCDAVAFEEALEEGKAQQALTLYGGDLLKGFYVPDAAPAFHDWLDRERERLRLRAAEGAWRLAEEAEQAGRRAAARERARQAAGFTPFSDEAQQRLIMLLNRLGSRASALSAYEAFAARLRREWGMEPTDEVKTLVEGLQAPAREGTGASSRTEAERAPNRSIAVLPFETLGAAQASAFAEGVHGDLLTRLSNVSDLQVISRTSVRRYRNTDKPISTIGAELNTPWVLEGEVQEAAEQVRVNVRLVHAQADQQVWARDYRRALTAENLFHIQGAITKEIVRSLKATLTPEEKKQIERSPTQNLEAYRLCVQGRRHLDERTEEGIRQAIRSFEQAIEQDPNYVLAWVGLADARALLHDYGHEAAERTLPQAEEAARQALRLDARSAEAHASLGLLHTIRHEGPAAVRELRRAVELRPSYAEAHNWLSWLHNLLGNRTEALESARQAVELNPLSPEAVSNLSLSHLAYGNTQKALEEARRDRDLGSSWGTAQFYEALALYRLEQFEDATSVLQGLSAPWAGVGPQATLALAHVATGDRTAARELLGQFEDEGAWFAAGLVYAALGETNKAFEAFERVDHWGHWPTLAMRHFYQDVWDRLRADERYEELRREVDRSWGLVEQQPAWGRGALQQPRSPDLDPHAIAVLPFDDLGGQDEATPFAAGLHHDLLTSLSRIGALTVISRTSVLRYQHPETTIPEIAQALKVGTIVEGGVRQAEGRVRLNVQLIDARDERLRWAETYDRELTAENLFDIQTELADKITGSLQAALTPEEQQRVDQRPTENLDAYRLYVLGRKHLDERTEEDIRQAVDHFQRATEQDARYALAWAGLSDGLSLLEFYGFAPPDAAPEPMEAAHRAVALAPNLGEARAALGIRHALRHEGPEALCELGQAVELAPSHAEAWIWLGWVQLCLGRPAKALEPAERAVALDPLAPAFHVYLAEIYLANGKLQHALREARRARELQPKYGLAYFMEGLVLYHQGRLVAAASSLRQALSLVPPRGTPTHAEVRAVLALAHVVSGDDLRARELLDQIDGTGHPFSAGLVRAALGDTDAAFDAFAHVHDWGSFETEHVRYFFPQALGPLRDDARYENLIQRVNRAWGLNADGSLPENACR